MIKNEEYCAHNLSIRLPASLFEELKHNARLNGKTMSDLARDYLSAGMKISFLDQDPPFKEGSDDMQKRLTVFTLFTHCLLEEFIKNTVPNSSQICNLAETKAEQMAMAMLKKDQTTN